MWIRVLLLVSSEFAGSHHCRIEPGDTSLGVPFGTHMPRHVEVKANPDRASAGNAGVGSQNHDGHPVSKRDGTRTIHVPYHGDALALQDLIGGQIDRSNGQSNIPSTMQKRVGARCC